MVSINGLDIHEEVMDTSLVLELSWTDSRLQWDPIDFSGISHTSMHYDNIWLPRIGIANLDAFMNSGIEYLNNPVVYHDGKLI